MRSIASRLARSVPRLESRPVRALPPSSSCPPSSVAVAVHASLAPSLSLAASTSSSLFQSPSRAWSNATKSDAKGFGLPEIDRSSSSSSQITPEEYESFFEGDWEGSELNDFRRLHQLLRNRASIKDLLLAFYAVRFQAPLSLWNRVLFELAHRTHQLGLDKELHLGSTRILRVHLSLLLTFHTKLVKHFGTADFATYASLLHAYESHVISHPHKLYQFAEAMRKCVRETPGMVIAPRRMAFAYGVAAQAVAYKYSSKENATELFDAEFPGLLKEYFELGGQPNHIIYTYFFQACGKAKSLAGLHLVFGSMREHHQAMDRDVCIAAMAALGKIGAPSHTEAVQMYNSLQGVAWNDEAMLQILTSLAASYASVGDVDMITEIATDVLPHRYGIQPDVTFFTVVTSAAVNHKEAFAQILELMDSLGVEKDRTLLLRIASIAAVHSNPDLVVSTLSLMNEKGYHLSRLEIRGLFNSCKASGCYPLIRNMHALMRSVHIPLMGSEWNWLMSLMAKEFDLNRLRKMYRAFIKLHRAKKYPDIRPPSYTTFKTMFNAFFDIADPHLVMKIFWDLRWLHPTGRIFHEMLARVLHMSYLIRVRRDPFNEPDETARLDQLAMGTSHPLNPLAFPFSEDEYRAMAALQKLEDLPEWKQKKRAGLAAQLPFLEMKKEEAVYVPVFRILRLFSDLEKNQQLYDFKAYHILQLLPAYAVSKHFNVNPNLIDGLERLCQRHNFKSLSHAVETAIRTNQVPQMKAALAMKYPGKNVPESGILSSGLVDGGVDGGVGVDNVAMYEPRDTESDSDSDHDDAKRELTPEEAVLQRVKENAEKVEANKRKSKKDKEKDDIDESMDEHALLAQLEEASPQ